MLLFAITQESTGILLAKEWKHETLGNGRHSLPYSMKYKQATTRLTCFGGSEQPLKFADTFTVVHRIFTGNPVVSIRSPHDWEFRVRAKER